MHTIDPPKLPFIIQKMLLQILATRFTMREWEREREREEWEKNGQHKIALRNGC
jgi:hypothetical protein